MSYDHLHIEVEGGIGFLTIDNAPVNALSKSVIKELDKGFAELKANEEVGVIIFTGAGKAFIAGADIKELNQLSPLEAIDYARTGQHLTIRMENMPKPIIAAVNGWALGGGCEMAMACTMRIASEKAVFGQPEVKLGVIPGFGGTQRLPRLVGTGVALQYLLTGDNISAEEAYRIGLANKVVAPDALMDEAKAMAGKILNMGPVAVRFAKDACIRGMGMSLPEGLRLEADLFGAGFTSEDAKEGTAAFLEKRKANFTGK